MTLKQPNDNKLETNNWLRWGIGIIVTTILGLTVHLGNEGSRLKKEIADMKATQAAHQEAMNRTDKKIDKIDDKLDRLIERK